ncbi:hypothetical protein HYY75_02240, partial [bacterium]|nr:hypothetical protein [bacterium]
RLTHSLDSRKHFTEQKNISSVLSKSEFVIKDITTSKLEVYDSFSSVFSLFVTLSNNANLIEFGFITNWPELAPEKKRELYSKYSCHELNFFLYKKDPDFFKSVILPYIANKKDKTFLDRWLLGDELTEYLKPWAYRRLNIVEQILLSRRIKSVGPSTLRHVTDIFDLIPPDVERFNYLFKTALKSSALEAGDKLGFAEAGKKQLLLRAPTLAPPLPPGPSAPGVMLGIKQKSSLKKNARFPAPESKMAKEEEILSEASMESAPAVADDAPGKYDRDEAQGKDRERRRQVRQFYQALDKTEEWVENNYYHLPIEQQLANLVTVNGFWKDYAAHPEGKPFLSTRFAEASRNFPEMMFALSVLDLPFTPSSHDVSYKDGRMKLLPGNDAVIFHKEIMEAELGAKTQEILSSQNFFAHNDRYRYENNERFDKFVTEEFQTMRVYGCQAVLTNPTSTRRKADVLLQIPTGAIPVLNGFYTKSMHVQLEPYSTQTIDYYFYFPSPGKLGHFPIHIAQNEKLIGFTEPFDFVVVDQLTKIDKTSWQYVSQNGTDEEVIKFLQGNNIDRLDLSLMAFRMRNGSFFKEIIDLLQSRHVYNDILWSFGIFHNEVSAAREFLQHSSFANQCGLYIDTDLLTLNPILRHSYQHKEYWPLVNARVNQLGKVRKIVNRQLFSQYTQFLTYLQYRSKLDDADFMGVTYYLLLQDRIEEAIKFFNQVSEPKIVSSIQFQYMKAFLAFFGEKPEEAVEIAKKFKNYGVDRWKNRFLEVIAQADEITGKETKVIDKEDRNQLQTRLAATEASLDFKVENQKLSIQYQNLNSCAINYYPMDIELLFSRNPFVQEVSRQFSIIQPNETTKVELPPGVSTFTIEIPSIFRDKNVMIEILGGGVTKSQAYFPHSLAIQVMENYGNLRITHDQSGKPLAKVYVKVYARMKNQEVKFFKDGYTDLRGRFDYTSLSTNELDNVERFAILIMSENNGAVVREAAPPKM